MTSRYDVAVIGMGYVGLTLAATLAELGMRIWGCEREPRVVKSLERGIPHIFEPGLEAVVSRHIGQGLEVATHLPPSTPGAYVICVSTPVGPDRLPDLRNLRAAAESVAEHMQGESLVIIRSTVPVGTSRGVVLPVLAARHPQVRLACCPERTIQGLALQELRRLPQVVGGLDGESERLAVRLWEQVTQRVVTVSSLEAAEMVKLINNCHTDLLYSFGNEVAAMASLLDLDPAEVIRAANLDYPRPSIARPGFVAGPCLTKDPYLLMSSFKGTEYTPRLVATARAINEWLPAQVAGHFVESLEAVAGDLEGAKVLVCGFAYKGWPPTDDLRGSPTLTILDVLRQYPLRLYGHDYLVPASVISSVGATPVEDPASGMADATGVLFVNEHPQYRQMDIVRSVCRMRRPSLVYDCWRMFDARAVESVPGIHYAGIGYG